MPDRLELGAPPDLAKRRRGAGDGPLAIEVAQYTLRRAIPTTNDYDGECFAATATGSQFDVSVFVRRFPKARMAEASAALRRRALTRWIATEAIFDLAELGDHAIVISEYVEGLSLEELRARLDAQTARLPWPVAVAMTSDICDRITELRDANVPLPAITPARWRLACTGRITACISAPEIADIPWHRRRADAVLAVLALAATDEERAILARFAGDDDPAMLAVVADAIVDRRPETAPELPAILGDLPLDRRPLDDATRTAIGDLWDLVAARGDDSQVERALANPS